LFISLIHHENRNFSMLVSLTLGYTKYRATPREKRLLPQVSGSRPARQHSEPPPHRLSPCASSFCRLISCHLSLLLLPNNPTTSVVYSLSFGDVLLADTGSSSAAKYSIFYEFRLFSFNY